MHGGMKVYAGAPAAARHYVEADRGRADDYYLTEGPGIARRYTAGGGRVHELAALIGDTYEAWVAGLDPDNGTARGRLRTDDRAVRFVEVVVNGPKSWSLAAALHSDVAAAYDAAQDRAAVQIIGWLAQHVTTRVGPRDGQVQVPIERLEAVTVRHYTSRAGDPHRHLHLQLGARVFAAGRWRGLHTVGVRDFLSAINGIGHAAVACDPQFRAALAAHGYTLDGTGNVPEIAAYAAAFSARAAQITRNVDRYEGEWTRAHPGEVPGPGLRRAWDARAWAEGRPDKVTPRPGTDLTDRWVAELAALGYRNPDRPVDLAPTPIGALDRDAAVERVLSRLAAARSAWNAADVRGQVEQLIAAAGVVVDAGVRIELAEDLTARAMARCVPLLHREGVPKHIRAWTSQPVLDVEADLTDSLAARGRTGAAVDEPVLPAAVRGRLDAGQAAAVAALTGERPLVVLEGAAGAGKTTTLAATRALLRANGRELVIVTPTLKAAKVAAAEVGTHTGSAAGLAYQHGWRWTDERAWTRLAVGEVDPATGVPYAGPWETARLAAGDLLVVDEAGMLDQATARALLTVADEAGARLALLGDRHQLAAVGRGGVLDLAVRQVDPTAHLTLDAVHRFTRTDQDGRTIPDTEYAELTLAMRTGEDPGAVFDALITRGRIRLHPDPGALQEALAMLVAAYHGDGEPVAVVVDTREQATELSGAIRDRLVADGRVDDRAAVITGAGQRISVGDRIATRRNDRDLGVANRDVWTVVAVDRHGGLAVTPASAGIVTPAGVTPTVTAPGGVTPPEAGQRALPAGYVTSHVELAYASTAHGVQGDTVAAAHLVVDEHTGAAAAYVGMTRGRTADTAHLVAADLAQAREQWVAVFGRDRADLGPGHAAELAAAEAARDAVPRPFERVLAELQQAWTVEQRSLERLAVLQPWCDDLRRAVALEAAHGGELARLDAEHRQADLAVQQATQRVQAADAVLAQEAERIREGLLAAWDAERGTARAAARVVLEGPGWWGLKRAPVARAGEQLAGWADRWRAHLPDLPTEVEQLARVADRSDDRPALWRALDTTGHRAAEAAHPERAELHAAAQATVRAGAQAQAALTDAHRRCREQLAPLGPIAFTPDPAGTLAGFEGYAATARHELAAARARIADLRADPALLGQPPDRLTAARDAWRAHYAAQRQRAAVTPDPAGYPAGVSRPDSERYGPRPARDVTPSLGR
jgi:exodeoxyribonuclease V alpha subunit